MINQSFLKTLNVLYVEDSKTIRKQFSSILYKLFDNVIISENGKEGIEKFKANKNDEFEIHLIISDINMPVMNGIELLEEIRKINSDIPFILTTAHTEKEYLLDAIKLGATEYIIKPVNVKELISTSQKVCQDKYHERIKEQSRKDLSQLTTAINEVALVTKTDLKGHITLANKFFCECSGYTQKELIGQTHSIVRHEDVDNETVAQMWVQIQTGNTWEGKIKNKNKKNETFYAYLTIIPIFDESDSDIVEYMWIRFLSTQEEIEQINFKKKVAKNIHDTRRINLQARQNIDELEAKLVKYKHFDFVEHSLGVEKKRSIKFLSQIKYYEKEVDANESKLEQMNTEANKKIKKAIEVSNELKDKKDIAIFNLEKLVKELESREGDVIMLNKEIERQLFIIDDLKGTIETKEEKLGLTDE